MKTLFRSLGVFALFALVAATLSGCSGGSSGGRDDSARANFTFSNVSEFTGNSSPLSVRGNYDDDTISGVLASRGADYFQVEAFTPNEGRLVGLYLNEVDIETVAVGTSFDLMRLTDFQFEYAEDGFARSWSANGGAATVVSRSNQSVTFRVQNASMVGNALGANGTPTINGTITVNLGAIRNLSATKSGSASKSRPAR